jgi:hypothetical protein
MERGALLDSVRIRAKGDPNLDGGGEGVQGDDQLKGWIQRAVKLVGTLR